MKLDPIDYKLIDLLQKHGRMTQLELASEVGMSQPAVAERIKRLEQDGIITGYTARTDRKRLGKDITAFIGVRIEHPKYNLGFARKIQANPDVLECHRVTGEDSYLLKVVTENTESLDQLICDTVRTIPGVSSTHTVVVMSSVKESMHIKPLNQESKKAAAKD